MALKKILDIECEGGGQGLGATLQRAIAAERDKLRAFAKAQRLREDRPLPTESEEDNDA